MLIGPLDANVTTGIDEARQVKMIPKPYTDIMFTHKVEVIGPELVPI